MERGIGGRVDLFLRLGVEQRLERLYGGEQPGAHIFQLIEGEVGERANWRR